MLRQGKRVLNQIKINLNAKDYSRAQIDINKCERKMGVFISPSLK